MKNIKISSVENFLEDLASQMNTSIKGSTLTIPQEYGKGFIHKVKFEKEIIFQEEKFLMFKDTQIHRKIIDRENYFSLYFLIHSPLLAFEPQKKEWTQQQLLFFDNSFQFEQYYPSYLDIHQYHLFIHKNKFREICERYSVPHKYYLKFLENENWLYQTPHSIEVREQIKQLQELNANEGIERALFHQQIEQLILWSIKNINTPHKNSKSNRVFHEDLHIILQVGNLLLQDEEMKISINDIIEKFAIGERKLQRLFKSHFGESMNSYRKRMKLEQGKKMLEQGHFSITEISYRLGYSSPSHFSKIFKDFYKVSPSEYI